MERMICVPYSSSFSLKRAKPDVVVWAQSPHIFYLPGASALREEAVVFDSDTGSSTNLSILLWACEFKREEQGEKQLTYDLGAAQQQRRALGFTKHSIYGATINRKIAKIYVSYWKDLGLAHEKSKQS